MTRKHKSYKYPILNDRDWLYARYWVDCMSTRQIASMVGCKDCNSVRQALIRFDIPVRNVSDGITVLNTPINVNKSVIDGCLLGDAYMRIWNKSSPISNPYFAKTNKYLDHVVYVGGYFRFPK